LKKKELSPHQVRQQANLGQSGSSTAAADATCCIDVATRSLSLAGHTNQHSSCRPAPTVCLTHNFCALLQALPDLPQQLPQLQRVGVQNLGFKTAAAKSTPRVHHVQQFKLLQHRSTAALLQAAALANRCASTADVVRQLARPVQQPKPTMASMTLWQPQPAVICVVCLRRCSPWPRRPRSSQLLLLLLVLLPGLLPSTRARQ
jgi:hypothetical protein